MNPTLRRSISVAAAVLAAPALSTVLSSCGSNFNAPTDQVYTPGVGVNDRSGSVDVLHALVVSGSDGSGTVIAGLVNNDQENADKLMEVVGAGDDQSLSVSTSGEAPVPPGGFYQLADEGDVSVTGEQIQPGSLVELTFSFENAESVTLDVPVVPASGDFADVPLPSGE